MTDFGSAFAVALVITLVGWVLSTPLAMAQAAVIQVFTGSSAPSGPDSLWMYAIYINAAFAFAVNLVLFFVVASVMSGVKIRGFLGPLLAVVLMTAADMIVPRALFDAGLSF